MRRVWWRWAVVLAGAAAAPAHAREETRAGTPARVLAVAPPERGHPGSPASSPAPGTGRRERLIVVAGGDVSFGREAGQAVLADAEYRPFRGIEPVWAGADLRFVNLESSLVELGGETQSPYDRLVFAGPPAAARVLASAGVQVVSTANNHAWDYGRRGLLETLLHLGESGVAHAGTGATREAAERPVTLELRGYRIALLAVTAIWNQGELSKHPGRHHVAWANVARLCERVAAARAEHDLVFVSHHGGAEYVNAPASATRELVRRVMAAGADAVFGHHPHVVQGVGWFDGRPAFYSLGNLLFGSRRGYPWTRYGMLARLELAPSGTRRVELCPYRIEIGTHEPELLHGRYGDYDRRRFRRHLERVNAEVGRTLLAPDDADGCIEVTPDGTSVAPRRQLTSEGSSREPRRALAAAGD